MKWFRFYHRVVSDAKIQMLPIDLRWRWVECLCLASDAPTRGRLPSLRQVAYAMRLDLEAAGAVLQSLVDAVLLTREGDGFAVHDWEEYQRPSDDAASRMRRLRADRKTRTCSERVPNTPRTRGERARTEGSRSTPGRVVNRSLKALEESQEPAKNPMKASSSERVPNMFGPRLDLEEIREDTPPFPPTGGVARVMVCESPPEGTTTQAPPPSILQGPPAPALEVSEAGAEPGPAPPVAQDSDFGGASPEDVAKAEKRLDEIFGLGMGPSSHVKRLCRAGIKPAWIIEAAEAMALHDKLRGGFPYMRSILQRWWRLGESDGEAAKREGRLSPAGGGRKRYADEGPSPWDFPGYKPTAEDREWYRPRHLRNPQPVAEAKPDGPNPDDDGKPLSQRIAETKAILARRREEMMGPIPVSVRAGVGA